MTAAITRGRLSWCVGGVALLLAGAVAAEAWPRQDGRTAEMDLSPIAAPTAASSAPDAPPVDDWVSTALSRPLFAQDRRPDATGAAPDEALPRLSGTIRFADTALAIFQPDSPDGDAKSVVVGQGADLSGWTITDITADGVTLMRDGRIATLRLSFASHPVQPRHLGMLSTRVLHDKRSSVFWQP
jgi:hypothetical protein